MSEREREREKERGRELERERGKTKATLSALEGDDFYSLNNLQIFFHPAKLALFLHTDCRFSLLLSRQPIRGFSMK